MALALTLAPTPTWLAKPGPNQVGPRGWGAQPKVRCQVRQEAAHVSKGRQSPGGQPGAIRVNTTGARGRAAGANAWRVGARTEAGRGG